MIKFLGLAFMRRGPGLCSWSLMFLSGSMLREFMIIKLPTLKKYA